MKTITAGAAIALTSVSLIACAGWSTPAVASPAGLGGGSNVGHNTPSHAPAFGRGFASALVANGLGVSGPGTLTSDDRWGPNKTVAFGRATRGWGPYEVNHKPGVWGNGGVGFSPIKCPCVVAYDPFNKRINGGVDFKDAKILANGVTDWTFINQYHYSGATFAPIYEAALMDAVWGPNSNPENPFQQPGSSQQQVASGHQQMWPTGHER